MVCSHAQASVLLWNIRLLCHKTTFCFIFVLFFSVGGTRALNPEITLPWLGNEKWSWDRQLTSYSFYCQITRRGWFAMNGVGNSNSNGTLLLFGAWCCHNQFPQTITRPFGNNWSHSKLKNCYIASSSQQHSAGMSASSKSWSLLTLTWSSL